jgi:hypothetical protein
VLPEAPQPLDKTLDDTTGPIDAVAWPVDEASTATGELA